MYCRYTHTGAAVIFRSWGYMEWKFLPPAGEKSQLCTRHASSLARIPTSSPRRYVLNESSTDWLLKYMLPVGKKKEFATNLGKSLPRLYLKSIVIRRFYFSLKETFFFIRWISKHAINYKITSLDRNRYLIYISVISLFYFIRLEER